MIDLKKIEAKIDALLASETDESLNAWYASKYTNNLDCYLGDVEYDANSINGISFFVDAFAQPKASSGVDKNNSPESTIYSNAA